MRYAPLLLTVLMACTPPNSTGSATPAQAVQQNSVTGTVRVVGSAPVSIQTVVQDSAGRTVQIEGPLEPEIRRLSGAQVTLWGRSSPGSLLVTAYDVRSVNGAPAQMGIVERAPDGGVQLRTADGQVVGLIGATGQFRVGQKVWVQGPAAVRVQSYGVITP